MGVEVLMSGGGGGGGGDGGVMEFNNKETWNGVVGAEIEVDKKRNGSPVAASTAAGNDSIVRWERFLPKMMVRVLVVESDDSTRQIITALLRKCSYKVCAVSDGLKAWELLKGKAQNFDLILAEVDLPSISGFALLTLIMEHKICKNIPVIMMSSQDSVNTVYKCMLKGAADFLVKPVRKNELKNLWQHVWRRQASSSSGTGPPPDESVAQRALEATAENDGTSKCSSSDRVVCIKRSREGVEKGSDDQSSCTKPDSEAEGTELDLPYSKRSKTSSTQGLQTNIGHNHLTKPVQDFNVGDEGSPATTGFDSKQNILQDTKLNGDWRQACGDNHAIKHSTREAIDLIGAFGKRIEYINRNSKNSYDDGLNKFDSLPSLDLSLKRSLLPYGLTDHVTEERRSLNHSVASAFSRYVNKTQCPGHSKSPTPCNQLGYPEAISDKHFFNHTVNINSDLSEPLIISPLASDQPVKIENRFPVITKLSLQNTTTYESLTPPAFDTNSTMMPQLQSSPDSVSHQETSFQASFNPVNHRTGDSLPSCNVTSSNADDDGKDQCKMIKEKQECHVSSATTTDQSANSGLCHGTVPESNGKQDSLSKRECGFDEALRVHVGDSNRSLLREAALMKFRLKRKDRCFEKKVRYESRKKLAEKRPRVKGQFVCQLSNQQLPPAKSSAV